MKNSVLIFIALIIGCSNQNIDYEPVRPENIPENAIWGGGPDGGSFFNCKVSDKQFLYFCTVYTDYGEIIVNKKEYKLQYSIWNKDEKRRDYYDIDMGFQPIAFDSALTGINDDIEIKGQLVLKPLEVDIQ